MRDIDLMTSQGQTILTFIGITSLIIPLLVLVIAPIALVVAVGHMLNKLGTDSEIIVMNGAGMSPVAHASAVPRGHARGIAAAGGDQRLSSRRRVCAMLRRWVTEVRADLVTNIVQPGRFIAIEQRPHLPHPRAPAERPAVGTSDRRPPRSRRARHHPRRAGRDREERERHLPDAGKRQHPAARERSSAIRTSSCSIAMPSTCRTSPADRQVVKYSVRERYLWD